MREVVIVGCGKMGELLARCLEEDQFMHIAAFCVDKKYKRTSSFLCKDLICFEDLASFFPPKRFGVIVAIGYAACNRARLDKINLCQHLGYKLESYISPSSIVPPAFQPPPNTVIFEGAIVQRFVTLGRGVTIWAGATVCHHSTVKDAVFIGPGATICGGTHIGERALVGAGAVVRDFLRVGEGAIVGAGSTLLRDLPEYALCNGGEGSVDYDVTRNISLWPPKTTRRVVPD